MAHPHSAQTCSVPHWQESPWALINEQELQSPSCGKKRGNLNQNRNPARGNISMITLSEDYCWSFRRKNSKPQLQWHKRLKS
jgi:hypothetical protein